MKTTPYQLTSTAVALASLLPMLSASAAETTPTATSSVDSFFNTQVPSAFTKGKFNLNARLRFEYADQEGGTPPAHAYTLRTRFGYTTAPLYGFQAMLEGENITAFDKGSYAPGPGSAVPKDVVADPTGTEINQAWLAYSNTNYMVSVKGGRQAINLDNARFVGDVGWRQNQQTFDAAGAKYSPIKGLDLSYNYVWRVNRIFGNDGTLGAATSNFDSDSHLINAAYTYSPLFKVVGYGYLLDLKTERGAAPGNAANSSATYGAYVSGVYTFDKASKGTVSYRAEYAYQSDYADSALNYDTSYYLADLGATYGIFNAGVGYEGLGSENAVGFKAPLATLHAFNGWADVFLNTPAGGLKDLYLSVGAMLPGSVPVKAIYHKFDAETGGADFGQEFDLVASRKFGKNWTVLAKYAYYDGKDAPSAFDKQVFWGQVEFNF
jgi:hypothetical protein